jgi:methionyl-tRNA formyltransferase
MKVIILTTETPHHAYFVRELASLFSVSVISETQSLAAPFPNAHPFEKTRDQYEQECWFGGAAAKLGDFAETSFTESANRPETVEILTKAKPDAIVVFGTGRLHSEVIDVNPDAIINLHGGDPEEYRGLDTHLWAVYHRDFDGLVSTLHRLNAELDDGDILLQANLPVNRNMALHELRRVNTEVCTDMTTVALAGFQELGKFVGRPQRNSGRYYSFMPTQLKEICFRQFSKYSSKL